MKLVISDDHEGLKAAVAKVLKATWAVLAHLSFPKAHRLQIHSTNPSSI